MGKRVSSTETRTPAKALLKTQYAEKAWAYHQEYDVSTASAALGHITGGLENTATITMAATSVKAARSRANFAARAACLDDWERRLKIREKNLAQCEDVLEGMATMCSRRSSVVLRALRLQWGRETAVWFHHGAGLALIALILSAVLAIGAHWQVRSWQCNAWEGMACWGVLGYTCIAGLSYLARLWVEERAIDSEESGAFVFACLMPFLHLITCLIAALWSVGMASVCHAV
ncbi:hypothetical protein AMS68_005978 [Peltaster fructicola]|uniref:Uncharacterized protein n=1 Tax=Peltaster fructicola TaxID=286661 RepID=A0A6H0Y0L3_9PEZI|nr:hypothetical protein AMS68_005978 [Peltaster fructicola]